MLPARRLMALALVLAVGVALGTAVVVRTVRTHEPVTAEGVLPPTGPTSVPAPPDAPPTILAAGDIADCTDGAVATGRLLAELPGVVAALGDLAYPDGSTDAFTRCYDPAWGAVRDRTRPAQGNHEVRTAGAAGYHAYFGDAAGPAPQGYYTYELGAWRVVVLNSNCAQVGGCGPGSPQLTWLREVLAADDPNVLAYWHHPRFSIGRHGDDLDVAPLWEALAAADADVVLNGHDHGYLRLAPLDAAGAPAPGGVRQFVVGTGGAEPRRFERAAPTVEVELGEVVGVLRLDLEPCGYRWAFLPADGGAPLDSGEQTGTC